jgi:hypothetical protein
VPIVANGKIPYNPPPKGENYEGERDFIRYYIIVNCITSYQIPLPRWERIKVRVKSPSL